MAHFAKIDENGIVLDVIVIDNSNAPDPTPTYSEPIGCNFIASLSEFDSRLEGTWIQTSYSGSFRNQFASVGGKYDAENDVFISQQPFDSWQLDEDFKWTPPYPMPSEGNWYWDEETLSWIEYGVNNPI